MMDDLRGSQTEQKTHESAVQSRIERKVAAMSAPSREGISAGNAPPEWPNPQASCAFSPSGILQTSGNVVVLLLIQRCI